MVLITIKTPSQDTKALLFFLLSMLKRCSFEGSTYMNVGVMASLADPETTKHCDDILVPITSATELIRTVRFAVFFQERAG